MRESKSSLAGVMMAAAMEGVGIWQFSENVLPQLEGVAGPRRDVVSRVDLPAICDARRWWRRRPAGGPGRSGAGRTGGPGEWSATLPAASDVPGVAGPQDVPGVAPADGAGNAPPAAAGAAPAAPAPPAAAPPAAAWPMRRRPRRPTPPKEPKAPKDDPAADAAKRIADENSPEAAKRAQEDEAATRSTRRPAPCPGSDALPGAPEGGGASADVPSGAVAVTPENASPENGPVKGALPESGKSGGITGAARRFTRRFSGRRWRQGQ